MLWSVGFAVGDDFHLVSRVGQKLVVFRAAFAGAGFESSGAAWDGIPGDLGEELVDERGLLARLLRAGVDGLGGVAQGVETALKTQAFQRHIVAVSGFLHQGSDKVVADEMDVEFLLDHRRVLAA